MHRLLSSLSWSPDVAEVMVATMNLEGVAHLEEVVVPMVVDRLLVIRDSGNVSTAKGITTSLKSAGRNLVAPNGYNWLILILLPLVI